jgi:hypothetical protein
MAVTSEALTDLRRLLSDMLGADGYRAAVTAWPDDDRGHPRIEIIAQEGACADCLVPKEMLRLVLVKESPPGIEIDEADIVYPGESHA